MLNNMKRSNMLFIHWTVKNTYVVTKKWWTMHHDSCILSEFLSSKSTSLRSCLCTLRSGEFGHSLLWALRMLFISSSIMLWTVGCPYSLLQTALYYWHIPLKKMKLVKEKWNLNVPGKNAKMWNLYGMEMTNDNDHQLKNNYLKFGSFN